jgi:prophage antirepressor-like protein
MTNNIISDYMTDTVKIEEWCGNGIRWIYTGSEWQAVASDVAKAMGYRDAEKALQTTPEKYKGTCKVGTLGGVQEVTTLTEKGLYRMTMRSNKPEAEAFQDWVYDVIHELRKSEDLKAYEAMQILSREHQKNAMSNLKAGLKAVSKVDYIKANTIADKAVSNEFGYKKMVKKADMSPAMLVRRQPVLDDVVDLMGVKDRFGLDLSVSKTIYNRKAM